MSSKERENIEMKKREEELFHILDKGIEDVRNNRIIPHEEAMHIIRERLKRKQKKNHNPNRNA